MKVPLPSRRWLIVPPMLIGVGVLTFALSSRRTPEPDPWHELARPLTVMTVSRHDVRPIVLSYGLAGPARKWQAIAEVDGRVIETYPELEPGIQVAGGTLLLKIDPKDYELEVAHLQAEIASLNAQIRQAEQSETNDYALLKVEEQSLRLAEGELRRLRDLRSANAASVSEVDRQQRELLVQLRSVQALKNSLQLVPVQISQLEATRQATQTRLEITRRDLERTKILAPFDCRLVNVTIEEGQYVSPNQPLFEVHGVEAADVEARVPLDDLATLFPTAQHSSDPSLPDQLPGTLAVVRVRSGNYVRELPGTVTRVRERIDRRTRTLGVVVRVEQQDSSELPLLDETFCEVELLGPTLPQRLVVPHSAVRGDFVYIVDDENRLRRRDVELECEVPDGVSVHGELQSGDRLVLTDPTPAVLGSLIDAVPVTAPERRLDGMRQSPQLTVETQRPGSEARSAGALSR